MRATRRRLLGGSAITGLALLCGAASGCNVLGVAAAKTLPPPKRAAAYPVAKGQPLAVRVTPAAGVYGTDGPLDAEVVAIALERSLRRAVGAAVVPMGELADTVDVVLEPATGGMLAGSDLSTGAASATVRVLDAGGAERWPLDGTPGRRVAVESPRTSGGTAADVRRATLRQLAGEIAGLFQATEAE